MEVQQALKSSGDECGGGRNGSNMPATRKIEKKSSASPETVRKTVKATGDDEMAFYEREVEEMKRWFARPRFKDITRLYSAGQVAQQRGTIRSDCAVARVAAEEFYDRLRELFSQGKSIT